MAAIYFLVILLPFEVEIREEREDDSITALGVLEISYHLELYTACDAFPSNLPPFISKYNSSIFQFQLKQGKISASPIS